jgi:hypothetical protein
VDALVAVGPGDMQLTALFVEFIREGKDIIW